MPWSFTSRAQKVLPRSKALRLSIPQAVAAILDLRAGDTVEWIVEPGTGRVTISKKGSAFSRTKAPIR